jgi:hypothetical protein
MALSQKWGELVACRVLLGIGMGLKVSLGFSGYYFLLHISILRGIYSISSQE